MLLLFFTISLKYLTLSGKFIFNNPCNAMCLVVSTVIIWFESYNYMHYLYKNLTNYCGRINIHSYCYCTLLEIFLNYCNDKNIISFLTIHIDYLIIFLCIPLHSALLYVSSKLSNIIWISIYIPIILYSTKLFDCKYIVFDNFNHKLIHNLNTRKCFYFAPMIRWRKCIKRVESKSARKFAK